jgi:signal transduction histidine kinase
MRIARDVHDELGQVLTALKFDLASLRAQASESQSAHLDRIQSQLNQAIVGVRNWSMKLRPAMLDDLGLLPALIWLLKHTQESLPLDITLRHHGLESFRCHRTIEVTAYRIVQEALTNVARHAQTRAALVQVWTDELTLKLIVSDRGVGFDVHRAEKAGESVGLAGMRERVRWVGGQFTVVSEPGSGAKIMVELPCNPPDMPHL